MREALIVWGGWSGHEPEKGARIVAAMLEAALPKAITKVRPCGRLGRLARIAARGSAAATA